MARSNILMNPRIVCLVLVSFLFGPALRAAEQKLAIAGITEPFLDVTLSASVPGIISRQALREGDWVKEGQVILELDKRTEELEEARRKLVMDTRKIEFDSTQVLFKSTKAVSTEELEKKEVEYKVASVEHDMAAEQLRKRLIAAPITGTITEINLDLGEACQPYQPLVRVVDTRQCYFVSNLEGKTGGRLKAGQTVTLEIDSGGPPMTVQAKLIFISPVVDPASGLMKVKAIFDNQDGKVRPGLGGRLLIE